jgi:hypothetical protein
MKNLKVLLDSDVGEEDGIIVRYIISFSKVRQNILRGGRSKYWL